MATIDRSKIKFKVKEESRVFSSKPVTYESSLGNLIPVMHDTLSYHSNNDIHVEPRGYYGCIIRYCPHCREYVEFYNESLWKELNGVSSEYEFDWEYLDLEEKGWYLHVCKNSNIVAFLKSIVLKEIA